MLATRFRQPLPIILGILAATLANHALAAFAGQFAAAARPAVVPHRRRPLFIAMGLWTLIPDKLDEDEQPRARGGVFLTTLVAFFLVEMGDKTQIATVALGAQYDALVRSPPGPRWG